MSSRQRLSYADWLAIEQRRNTMLEWVIDSIGNMLLCSDEPPRDELAAIHEFLNAVDDDNYTLSVDRSKMDDARDNPEVRLYEAIFGERQ